MQHAHSTKSTTPDNPPAAPLTPVSFAAPRLRMSPAPQAASNIIFEATSAASNQEGTAGVPTPSRRSFLSRIVLGVGAFVTGLLKPLEAGAQFAGRSTGRVVRNTATARVSSKPLLSPDGWILTPKQLAVIDKAVTNLQQGKKNINDLVAIIDNATPTTMQRSFIKFSKSMQGKSLFEVAYQEFDPSTVTSFMRTVVKRASAMRQTKFDSALFEKRILDFAKTVNPKDKDFHVKTLGLEGYTEFLAESRPPKPVSSGNYLIRPGTQAVPDCAVMSTLNALTYNKNAVAYLQKNVITRKNGGVEIKLLKPRWDKFRRLTYEDDKRITYFFSNKELDQIALSSGDRVMRALEAALMCSCIERCGLYLRGRGGGEMLRHIFIDNTDLKFISRNTDVKEGFKMFHDKAKDAPNFIRTLSTAPGMRISIKDLGSGSYFALRGFHQYSVLSIDAEKGIVTITDPSYPHKLRKISIKDCNADNFSKLNCNVILTAQ
jgi:hypothetical protein